MLRKLREAIVSEGLLEEGERVVVAVSGGADSVALLSGLAILADELALELIVAHLNHGMRGEESGREAAFVRDLSLNLNLPCEAGFIDVPSLAKMGRSLEEMCRQERYAFLTRVAKNCGATKIALGHNREDQAETVLMNILRGCGLEGLRGMLPKRDGIYIRPLLAVSREEIVLFLKGLGQGFMKDSSNSDERYLRNRLRHRLLPELRASYNPNMVETLNRMAETLRRDDDFIAKAAWQVVAELGVTDKDTVISVPIPRLLSHHPAVRARILKNLMERCTPAGQGISFLHVKALEGMLRRDGPSACFDLPHGLQARREYDRLELSFRKMGEGMVDFEYEVAIPGWTDVAELGRAFRFELMEPGSLSARPPAVLFDLEKLSLPLTVRNLRPGDRIQPLGMEGIKKLKSYFIDEKIPRVRRAAIPLLVDQESVVWIGGMRMSERVKITDKTRQVLKVEMI
ncbi:MAG: tRNA lysidine(34) synthetase TilS [Smithellaceae bacterium]|nr:tRNA lysidine(34) synthetase TilS [Smithellaceae bacterium]